MQKLVVLRVVSKGLIPFILLLAFYIQFHGEYSPGGGFQAGVIGASAFVLFMFIFGLSALEKVISMRGLRVLAAIGVLLYSGTGLVSVLLGHNFLDYHALGHGYHGQHVGIILVEAGVGITVFAVMLLLMMAFVKHKELMDEEA